MHSDANTQPYIEALARDALQRFDEISSSASDELSRPAGHGTDLFVHPNWPAEEELRRRRAADRRAYEQLKKEPAIARVMFDDNGPQSTWYICRSAALAGGGVRGT